MSVYLDQEDDDEVLEGCWGRPVKMLVFRVVAADLYLFGGILGVSPFRSEGLCGGVNITTLGDGDVDFIYDCSIFY